MKKKKTKQKIINTKKHTQRTNNKVERRKDNGVEKISLYDECRHYTNMHRRQVI